jgi:hypothetical protein
LEIADGDTWLSLGLFGTNWNVDELTWNEKARVCYVIDADQQMKIGSQLTGDCI